MLARKLLIRLIYVIIFLQLLLVIIDRFPVSLSLLSIGSHVVYAGNLRHFPVVKLSDPIFLLSCCRSCVSAERNWKTERVSLGSSKSLAMVSTLFQSARKRPARVPDKIRCSS